MVRRTKWYPRMLCILVIVGVAGGACAEAAPGANGPPLLVQDAATLQYYFDAALDTVTTYLAVEEVWTPIAGSVVDFLEAESPLPAVLAHFQPSVGATCRMCFRPDDAASWACTAWTTGGIVYAIDVPEEGQSSTYEYYTAISSPRRPTIASSGYIRVKKLNSGG